jgi:hypothetical protein
VGEKLTIPLVLMLLRVQTLRELLLCMCQNGGGLPFSAPSFTAAAITLVTGVTENLGIFVKPEKTASMMVSMVLPFPSPAVIASE